MTAGRAIFGAGPPESADEPTLPEDASVTMRPTMTRALSAAALIALAACGDGRLDKLAIGMPTDSVATVMASAPHRTVSYFLNGKTWEFSVFRVGNKAPVPVAIKTMDGRDSTITDSIPWREMSPVVSIDGKVVGWGWGWWDKKSAALGLPMTVPPAK